MKDWKDFKIGHYYYIVEPFEYKGQDGTIKMTPPYQKVRVESITKYGLGMTCVETEMDGYDFLLCYHDCPNDLLSETEYSGINGELNLKIMDIKSHFDLVIQNATEDKMLLFINVEVPKLFQIIEELIGNE